MATNKEPIAERYRRVYKRVMSVYHATSREAWEDIQSSLPHIDRKILTAIEDHGGLTCWQVEQVTGLSHQTVSAQIRHMVEGGLLRESGRRGPTATKETGAKVWELVPLWERPSLQDPPPQPGMFDE